MVYNGYFRSIDTSIDPKGQLYKVLIFTNISEEGYYQTVGRTPVLPKELQLSDQPFVVEYQNDGENVYKPYKCSTATVNIMMDRFDSNLISTKKNDILVYLLKWNNDIIELGSGTRRKLINNSNGAELNVVQSIDSTGHMAFDYDPRSVDTFAYSVEWVGYATPNTYNQPYVRILESYGLECQDAISTLRYYDYKRVGSGVVSFMDTINKCLTNLDGVYNRLYISGETFQQAGRIDVGMFNVLYCQEDNWFDEDNKPMNCLEVIEELLKYTNLTLIPFKDNILVVNPDAIISDCRHYVQYRFNNGRSTGLFVTRGIDREMVRVGEAEIGDTIDFTDLNVSHADASLSMTSTYKKVRVTTDEYYFDEMSADIGDDDQFERVPSSDWEQLNTLSEVSDVNNKDLASVWYEYNNIKVLNAGSILQTTDKTRGTVTCKNYGIDTWNNSLHTPQINQGELSEPTTWDTMVRQRCGCTPIEIGINRVNWDTVLSDVSKNYNGSRMFLFHTPAITKSQTGSGSTVTPVRYPLNWFYGSHPQHIQPMLTVETDNMYLNNRQYVQITGNWRFYNTRYLPYSTKWDTSVNDRLYTHAELMYVWAKVYVEADNGTKMWLKNRSTTYDYEWSTTEQWVKLWYGGQGWDGFGSEAKGWWWKKHETGWQSNISAFENDFSFIKNNRAVDGTVIQIPNINNGGFYGKVGVTFNRPVGCAQENAESLLHEQLQDAKMYFAQTTTLSNFSLNVIDDTDLEYRHEALDEERDKANGSFSVNMTDYAVDEHSDISLRLSSGLDKATNRSLVWYMDRDGSLKTPVNIVNNSLQIVGYPENNIARSIAGTYKVPHVVVDQSFHLSDVNWLNNYTWNSQFGGDKFVIDNMSIDYKMESSSIRLIEKHWFNPEDLSVFSDITRNFRRNGDNLANLLPKRKPKNVDDQQYTVSRTVTMYRGTSGSENGCLCLSDRLNASTARYTSIQSNLSAGEILYLVPDFTNVTAEVVNDELIITTPDQVIGL